MTLTYNFRYSKFAPNSILNILFIVILSVVGILISIAVLFYIINYRILRARELTFWKQHQKLVLSSILWLPIMFAIMFSFIASILYRHFIDDKSGVLNIFNNYAILYYKGKEITLEKGNFYISSYIISYGRKYSIKGFQSAVRVYIIETENKKYKIYESSQEAYELTTFSQKRKKIYTELSLSVAMKELKKLAKNESNETEKIYKEGK